MTPYPLGFRQKEDPRDKRFPLSALMKAVAEKTVSKVWKPGATLDQQGNSCVGHACYQVPASEPIVSVDETDFLSPYVIYDWARDNDEFEGNADEGTSVRAGLEALRHFGKIKAYYWTDKAREAQEYLLQFGPLVFGTNWHDSMFSPDANGFVYPQGSIVGGHAYFAYAANWQNETITFRNSWGEDYGRGGDFKMHLSDIDRLFAAGGVAAAVQEL